MDDVMLAARGKPPGPGAPEADWLAWSEEAVLKLKQQSDSIKAQRRTLKVRAKEIKKKQQANSAYRARIEELERTVDQLQSEQADASTSFGSKYFAPFTAYIRRLLSTVRK